MSNNHRFPSHQPELTKGIFLAEDYKKNSTLQWECATEALSDYSIDSSDKILDVGCGDGKVTALIAERVSDGIVVGIDISKKMIELASEEHQKSNLLFLCSDAKELPFYNQFDKIVSFNAMHWIVEQDTAYHSLHKSLKNGGTILIVVPGKQSTTMSTLSDELVHSDKWSSFFPDFKPRRAYLTVQELKTIIEGAGFTILSVEETAHRTTLPSVSRLIDFTRPLLDFTQHLNPKQHEEFVEDYVKLTLRQNPPEKDGSIVLQRKMITIKAKKQYAFGNTISRK